MVVDQTEQAAALWNEDAERSVLGGLLRKPDAVADVAQILTPEHFWRPEHSLMFKALLAMSADGETIDPHTLGQRLGKDVSRVGAPRILEIYEDVLHGESALHHAKIVKAKAVLREVHFVGAELAAQAAQGTGDPEELAANAIKRISEATRGAVEDRSEHVRVVLSRALDVSTNASVAAFPASRRG